jgi:serine/threonine protein kinase
MPLSAGTRLGPYEIESLLGAGGMGEVYRARDTRLERTVAIKVLPEHLTAVSESRRRFQREARLASQLSHPHICTLFDVGEQDGHSYIAMEYLEGETLAQRLVKGPLPLEQVLRYGVEIADALDHAHRQGKIVHRDLKPSNIMLTKSGVKLLDFGLARCATPPDLAESVSIVSTLEEPITERNTMLGTVQYMPPEQLEGGETDARTDVFALGAVLYEMATGRKAFIGRTRASLISSVLTSQPVPVASLQPLTPPSLDALIRTCLAKDPDERWQTAHDVKLQLRWLAEANSQAGVPVAVVHRRRWRERISWGWAALATIAATLFGIGYVRRVPQLSPPVNFTVELPPGLTVSGRIFPYISPDGRELLFSAQDSKGESIAILRSLDSPQSRILELPWQAVGYRWSYDSRHILYGLANKLWRMDLEGGAPEIVCEMPPSTRLRAINPSGLILLRSDPASDWITLSPTDCKADVILKGDRSDYDGGYEWPIFLPDGRHFLFVGVRSNKHHDILMASLDFPHPEVLVRDASVPKYVEPGYLIFEREGVILAQRFDASSRKISGQPLRVVPKHVNYMGAGADMDVSPGGTLVYLEQVTPPVELRWVDQSGQVVSKMGAPDKYRAIRLSPNGNRILMGIFDSNTHTSRIATMDLSTGVTEQQSSLGAPEEVRAAWSPDGRQIAYTALQGHFYQAFLKNLDDAGDGSRVADIPAHVTIDDWSPDGKGLLVEDQGDKGQFLHLYLLPLEGDHKPRPIVQFSGYSWGGRFSPDGKWLAYTAVESPFAVPNIYVCPVTLQPGMGHRITADGGSQPHWSGNGRQLFYLIPDHHVVAVTFTAASPTEFHVGRPVALFSTFEDTGFDVARDGMHFVTGAPLGEEQGKIFVTVNFGSTLAALHE